MDVVPTNSTTGTGRVAQSTGKAGRQLPMGLADIIMRCMQKNPDQRYRTMDELVNALIGVYRGIAAPGISTYVQAFPGGTGQRMLSPPPQPPILAGDSNPHAQTM